MASSIVLCSGSLLVQDCNTCQSHTFRQEANYPLPGEKMRGMETGIVQSSSVELRNTTKMLIVHDDLARASERIA